MKVAIAQIIANDAELANHCRQRVCFAGNSLLEIAVNEEETIEYH